MKTKRATVLLAAALSVGMLFAPAQLSIAQQNVDISQPPAPKPPPPPPKPINAEVDVLPSNNSTILMSSDTYDVNTGEAELKKGHGPSSRLVRDQVLQAIAFVGMTELNISADEKRIAELAKSIKDYVPEPEHHGQGWRRRVKDWHKTLTGMNADYRRLNAQLQADIKIHTQAYQACVAGLNKSREKGKVANDDPISCWTSPLDGRQVIVRFASEQ